MRRHAGDGLNFVEYQARDDSAAVQQEQQAAYPTSAASATATSGFPGNGWRQATRGERESVGEYGLNLPAEGVRPLKPHQSKGYVHEVGLAVGLAGGGELPTIGSPLVVLDDDRPAFGFEGNQTACAQRLRSNMG